MLVYNTQTHKKEEFKPIDEGKIRMYVCGPTVYDQIHIGNARTFLSFDVIRRYLMHKGYEVTFAQNLTDVDDKIIQRAIEQGRTAQEVSEEFSQAFIEQMHRFNILDPDIRPRATHEIEAMLQMIQSLIEQGYAYAVPSGDVYFSVRSDHGYGVLSGRDLDQLRAGERVEVNDEKRDPFDFALWKAAKPGEPSWPSPWGEGRPGWHSECCAMIHRYLGTPIDIHGGGSDLVFPHHENETAQASCAWHAPLANYWMHTGMLRVDGEKMSKSLGNVLSIGALTEEYPAVAVRWALSTVHHRSAIEWGAETLPAAHAAWEKFSTFVARAIEAAGEAPAFEIALAPADLPEAFVAAMDDDLNVAGALAVLHEHLKAGNAALAAGDVSGVYREQVLVRSMLDVLGLDPASEQWRGQAGIGAGASGAAAAEHSALDALVRAVLSERAAARAAKDWARADELRDRLAAAGVTVADGRDGATWSVG